jgi:RNA polymerase sigma factor (sigma-70 family)
MDRRTDQELLREFLRQRSEEAFTTLVRRHIDLVFSVALRVVADCHMAEDVAQAVFTALSRNARALARVESLSGWLHATARNQAVMKVRSEVRRRRREQEASLMNTPASAPEPDWARIEPELDGVISQLPEADRTAILLRYFERKPAREIAAHLRVTEEAAHKRVQRALERLRVLLARRGIHSTTAALAAGLRTSAVTSAPAGLAARVIEPALAAGVGGMALALSDVLLLLMTTKKWIAAGLLASGAFALAPLVLPESPRSPQVHVEFTMNDPSTNATPAPAAATGLRWAEIESPNYRQFIANLRASGAPEQLIHDTVSIEIYRQFAPRSREIWAANSNEQIPYWQKRPSAGFSPEQLDKWAALYREHHAFLVSLLGPTARVQEAINLLYVQPDFEAIKLAWLPPETVPKALGALEPVLEAERRESERQRQGSHTPVIKWMDQRLDALRPILTSEQLEEYQLREEIRDTALPITTRYFDLTEEEFKKLSRADRSYLYNSDPAPERRRQQEQKLASLLGQERTAAFIKATDITYMNTRLAMDTFALPVDAADRVWEIKRSALAERDRLLSDPTLENGTRQRKLAELADRTQASYAEVLGQEACGKVLGNEQAWWNLFKNVPSRTGPNNDPQ